LGLPGRFTEIGRLHSHYSTASEAKRRIVA
jgi:hypothetical protein